MLRPAAIACLFLSACAPQGPPRNPLDGRGDGRASASLNPFVPAEIQVHPLTRLEGDVLILHVQMRDGYRDNVKGAGLLQAILFSEEAPAGDLRWTIDLADPTLNARLYDRATKTYRCPLIDLPEPIRKALASGAGALRLRITLDTWDVDGSPRMLADERAISP